MSIFVYSSQINFLNNNVFGKNFRGYVPPPKYRGTFWRGGGGTGQPWPPRIAYEFLRACV